MAPNWKSGAIIAKPNSSGTQYFEAIIVAIKPTAGHTFLWPIGVLPMKTRGKQFGKNTQFSGVCLQAHCVLTTNNLLDMVKNNPLSSFLLRGRGQNQANSVTGWNCGVTNNDHDCCFPSVWPFLVHMVLGAVRVGKHCGNIKWI